ncbi:MAG TPA: nucleotide exchange factor GrpE [Planctomycetota bacterium]|nr:nucleotide exchange factor GrpE [Planctomycetota bacterium]
MAAEKPLNPEAENPTAPSAEASELEVLRAKLEESKDLSKRLRADLVNYQDRVRREKQSWTRQALDDFFRDFIPAMDIFTWARFEEPTLMESLRLMEREFMRVLSKQDVLPIDTQGKTFDPAFHEAVGYEEREQGQEGAIIEEVRRGWAIQGHVLRPSNVRIVRLKRNVAKDSGGTGGPATP